MISLLLALSLATAAPEAAASPTATDAGQPARPVKSAKPKKVCQKVEMTGSSVPKRVCRTVTEPATPVGDVTQAAAEKAAAGNMN
ncbi:hypothetical protein [Sphingopyxis sp. LK2115]|jgi:hypothetical protein|uniref:hypothetical protein n=1 Tax=Sphingopyxis sp. LK2115 TaxID=2744558 RepID=UPI00166016F3|nr:hypothetical protein [Sphingopyxis sp. LK2115]